MINIYFKSYFTYVNDYFLKINKNNEKIILETSYLGFSKIENRIYPWLPNVLNWFFLTTYSNF